MLDSEENITAKVIELKVKDLLNNDPVVEEVESIEEPEVEYETEEKMSPVKSTVAVVQSLQVIEGELATTDLDEEESQLLSEQVGHLEDLLNNIRAKIG